MLYQHLIFQTGELELVQIDVRSCELMKVVVRCVRVTAAVKQAHTSTHHTHHVFRQRKDTNFAVRSS